MNNNNQKRFGAIAVEKGFITEDQLFQALKIQAKENLAEGKHRLLGQILLEEGLITTQQIEEVLDVINQQLVYMISVGR
jgi:hypothetical protein